MSFYAFVSAACLQKNRIMRLEGFIWRFTASFKQKLQALDGWTLMFSFAGEITFQSWNQHNQNRSVFNLFTIPLEVVWSLKRERKFIVKFKCNVLELNRLLFIKFRSSGQSFSSFNWIESKLRSTESLPGIRKLFTKSGKHLNRLKLP